MLGITKNTVENLIIVLVGAILSHVIIYIPYIGPYVQTQPLYMIGGGVLIIALSGKIADTIKFLDRQLIKNFCYLLGGIFIFYGLATLPQAIQLLQQNALIIVGVSLLMLGFKDKIADLIGG